MSAAGAGAGSGSGSGVWGRREDKEFENGIAKHLTSGSDEEWKKIASEMSLKKSIDELKLRYKMLLDDVKDIEAGLVPLPDYDSINNNANKEASSSVPNPNPNHDSQDDDDDDDEESSSYESVGSSSSPPTTINK